MHIHFSLEIYKQTADLFIFFFVTDQVRLILDLLPVLLQLPADVEEIREPAEAEEAQI